MKTLLLLILLAIGLCQGSTEATKSSNALRFTNTRKLFTTSADLASDSEVDEEALSDSNSEPVTCAPARNLDFDVVRPGTISVIRYDTTAFECAKHCREGDADTCVAFNYYPQNRTCHELKTIAKMSNATTLQGMTSMVHFANGQNPCNEDNGLRDYHRPGSDYKVLSMASAIDCCNLCLSETEKCRVWDYDFSTDTCYLKDVVTMLRPWPIKRVFGTGFGCAAP